jgi:hypothetical protein
MSAPDDGAIPSVTAEIDLPPSAQVPYTGDLPMTDVRSLEEKKFEYKKVIDQRGFWLLVGSISLYFLMYVIEKRTGSVEMSKFTSTMSETMKFLISSLIGYLFANRL